MYALTARNPTNWNQYRGIIFKIAICISLLFCLLIVNYNTSIKSIKLDYDEPIEMSEFIAEIPITRDKPKPKKVPKTPKPKTNPQLLIDTKPIVKEEIIDDFKETVEDTFSFSEVPVDTTLMVTKKGEGKVEIIEPEENNEIIQIPEQMPVFGSCNPYDLDSKELRICSDNALLRFIHENLKYPRLARNQGIEGTVVIQFVVDKNGSVRDVNILRSLGGGCGEESKRIIAELPNWLPGKQNGRPVHVLYTVPIKFDLK